MNAIDTIQKQRQAKEAVKTSEQSGTQHFVLDKDFANQVVGPSTIDEIFTHRTDQIAPPVPSIKTGFKGMIEEAFQAPNDIYASDLMPSQTQMKFTPAPGRITKGMIENWSDLHESKVNLNTFKK